MSKRFKVEDRLQNFLDSGMWQYKGFMFTKEEIEILIKAIQYYGRRNEDDCTNVCNDENEV